MGRTNRNIFDWCCIIGLLVVLVIPQLGMFMAPDNERFKRIERRLPAPAPTLSFRLGRTFDSLENWFNDRVFLRFGMMKAISRLYVATGVSSNPEKVTIGKDGWLFLGDEAFDALTQHRRLDWEDRSDISQSITFFTALRNALAARNLPFVLLVAPDKHTIYPEKLPDWAQKQINVPSRFDLFKSGLERAGVTVVDPSEALLKHKSKHLYLYFPGGTHWNSIGALYAFRQLADHLRNYLVIPEYLFTEPVDYYTIGGDNTLYNWLQFSRNSKIKDTQPWFAKISRNTVLKYHLGYKSGKEIPIGKQIKVRPGMPPQRVLNSGLNGGRRALLIRDSFSNFLSPYLHCIFQEVVHVRHSELYRYTVMDLVEQNSPDVVIFQTVEKALKHILAMDAIGGR